MTSKNQKFIFVILLILFSFLIQAKLFNLDNEYQNNQENYKDSLRSAGYWELDYIHISGNWSQTAALYDWCSGDGSWINPYIIENVTIDGDQSTHGLIINGGSQYFIIRNCTFTNAGEGDWPDYNSGIWLNVVRNGRIENNNCSDNNYYGIYLRYSNNITIIDNEINSNIEAGVYLYRSNNNKIINSTINNQEIGISLHAYIGHFCDDNYIYGNTVRYNFMGLELPSEEDNNIIEKNDFSYNYYGMIIDGGSQGNQIIDNTISYNTHHGIYSNTQPSEGTFRRLNISRNDISNNYRHGIFMDGDSNEFYIYDNIFSNNGWNGMEVHADNDNYEYVGNYFYNNDRGLNLASYGNLISGNSFIENNGDGLRAGSNNNISHNFCQGNTGNGIAIGSGASNLISNNTLLFNDGNGISISNNDRNNCTYNYLKGNQNGMYISESDLTQFSGNNFNKNVESGVELYNSNNNTFFNNNFNLNDFGVKVIGGSYNLFYYNFFINSTVHALDSGTIPSEWDNNSIGNYWDDYNGYDNSGDGIGDTPYIITQSPLNQDHFPIWDISDTFSPVIVIFNPENNELLGLTSPTFELTIYEYNLSQSWYSLNGGLNVTFTGLNGTIDQGLWEACIDGLVLITFYTNDSMGNLGYSEVTVEKDSVLPEITIISPQTLDIFGLESPTYNVSIFSADLNTTWYSLNDRANFTFIGSTGKIDQNAWETCGNGTVKITFYANNSKANIAFNEVIVQRDTRVPNITIISPLPFSTYGSDPFSFEIDIDEPVLNTTWYSINGGSNYTFTGFTGTINQAAWNVCGNGTFIIRFYANNSLGNTAFTEVIIFKDLINPSIAIISPTSFELFGNSTFDFEIYIDDPELNSMWYNLNGINYSFAVFTGTIDQLAWDLCGNGTHLLTFFANDTYGNIGFSEVTVQKDILLPLMILNLPYDNQSCGPLAVSYELTLIGSDIHTSWYTLNDLYMNEFTGTMGRIEQQAWDYFGEGSISIKFYANNSIGNFVMQEVMVIKRLNIVSKDAYAIVIGVSNYPGTSSDLNYCDNDADEVYNMLINDYNFLPSNIIRMKDSSATKSAINNAFATINSKIGPNDVFYFYYSGHGGSELTSNTLTFHLNSPHPYPNDYDRTWYIIASDAAYIRVHFSDFDLESGYDYLYLGDATITEGYSMDSYTGYGTDFWSDWIPVLNDNRIYLRMISDYIGTSYGFRIDQIEVMRYSNPHYLCPYDSIPDSPDNYYLDSLLDTKLDSLKCDNIYTIIDACNSGGIIPETQSSGRLIMTACRDGQVSYEDPSLQNGIFSYYLINSLDNANDQNSDGVISMEEIFSYVSSGTQSYSGSYGPGYKSHPQISDGISGQAVLYPSIASVNINSVGNQLYYSFYLYGHGTLRTLNLSVCSISPSVSFKTEEIKYQYVSSTGFGYYAGVIEMAEGYILGGIELLAEIEGNQLITINLRYGDSDNDGLTDFFEIFDGNGLDPINNDTDGDGLSDGDEVNIYSTDPLNGDSDSDGLFDAEEINNYGTNPLSADTDGDGINDYDEINTYTTDPLLVDSDSDGINDYDEIFIHSTDPLNSDTDSDAVPDGDEINIHLTDPSNNDTDSDGLSDGNELYVHFTNPLLEDTDQDGINDFDEINIYSTDPLNIDTDSDTMPDGWEIIHLLDPLLNDSALDPDNDTLSNVLEYQYNTLPFNNDTDSDLLIDGDEVFLYGTDPTLYDTDSDGLSDYDEIMIHFTDPLLQDSDSDGISDYDELITHNTDPLDDDTDADTMPDGWEIDNLLDPLTNDTALDPDNDFLTNINEFLYNTLPQNNDTDSDLLLDGEEVFTYYTDPTNDDSDSDELLDGEEVLTYSTDPLDDDTDSDGLLDGVEVNIEGTNPLNGDTDSDGMPDKWEVDYLLNPLVNDTTLDPDTDDLTNIEEYQYNTDPQDADTDNDGWDDGTEVARGTDPLDPEDHPNPPAAPPGIPGYEYILLPTLAAVILLIVIQKKKLIKK